MKNEKITETQNAQIIAEAGTPVDMLLFCPKCGTQHVDEAKPDNCESCGHGKALHQQSECKWARESGGGMSEKLRTIEFCHCKGFTAWLNPPHKSHRCHSCNHVWRPFEYPTNGVAETNNFEVIAEGVECGRCAELEAQLKELGGYYDNQRRMIDRLEDDAEAEFIKFTKLEKENAALQQEIKSLKRKAVGRRIRHGGR